jgi:long-chain acyl-CoA synthetase
MIRAERSIEHGRADVSCRACEKDLHEGSYIIIQPMRRDTLLDFFDDVSASRGEFLVYDDGYRARSYTYAETAHGARGFAARLQSAGIGKGDKVVFWSENRPEWILALWGCLLNGSIVVPIDYRTSGEFVSRVAQIVGARLFVIGDDVEEAAANPPQPDVAPTSKSATRKNVVPTFRSATWKLSEIDFRALDPTAFEPAPITRDDTVEIIFTSGATAEPKGVVLTHRNVLANIVPVEREVRKYSKYGRPFFPIRFLNLLPLSHMFGQAMATFVPPLLGGTVVLIRGNNPHQNRPPINMRPV